MGENKRPRERTERPGGKGGEETQREGTTDPMIK